MLKINTVLLAALLVGCDSKDDDSGSTDTIDTTTDGFTPEDGDWFANDETVNEDTCGITDDGKDTKDDEPLTLTMTSDTTFTLSDGPDFSMVCTLDTSSAFTCEPDSTVTDYGKHGFAAVVTYNITMSGAFTSSVAGTSNIEANFSCDGADCPTLSKLAEITLPCSASISYTITHGG